MVKKISCPSNHRTKSTSSSETYSVKSTFHEIQISVRADVLSNGQVIVSHDEIKFGDISFTVHGSFNNEPDGMIRRFNRHTIFKSL